MSKSSGKRPRAVEAHQLRDADRSAAATRSVLALARQGRLVHALAASLARRDGVQPQHLETHISHVLLHGGFAYKIKKALRTPFLDQSTLALRRRACAEELRLNRRLAPDLYLDVVSIKGTRAKPVSGARPPEATDSPLGGQRAKRAWGPVIGGEGRSLEVAVKMRAFDQAGLWDRLAVRGELRAADVDELAQVLARFHAQAAVLDSGSALGTPACQHANVLETLNELRAHAPLADLAAWLDAAYARLAPVMARRRAAGRVRECHGDLHLGNIAREHGHCLVFDGIEFNERLRWIDVMSDVAFIAMDLEAHALPALAHRLVNAYLEACGDYDGLRVLGCHIGYRALVRARVAQMRAAQTAGAVRLDALQAASRYLALAAHTARPTPRALLITHGLSGSGKTTLSFGLVEAAGAVRVRADVERKRLAGLAPLQSSRSVPAGGGGLPPGGLYTPDVNAATYARLFEAAAAALDGGRLVVLDATFLRHDDRAAAQRLAASHGVPFAILCFEAAPDVLRARLRQRATLGHDASEADEQVLALQLQQSEPLRPDERRFAYDVPPCSDDTAAPRVDWAPLLAHLGIVTPR